MKVILLQDVDKIGKSFIKNKFDFMLFLISFIIFLCIEWINRQYNFGLERLTNYRLLNWMGYLLLLFMIAILKGKGQEFIYFQF